MKIRAAVLHEAELPQPYAASRPLRIEEVELGDPGSGELLVRIEAAGLCHSDLSVINGDRPRPLPMVVGHEAAGRVERLGDGVEDIAVGDLVVMVFVPSCGHCLPCAEGRPALCEPGAAANARGELLAGGSRLSRDGRRYSHHVGVSAFAEAAIVSRHSVVKVEPGLSAAEAALFGCAVITGVGAVINTAQVKPGTTVAVVGLGGVGLNALLGARLAGARRIVAIDLEPRKLELARQLGATDAFDAKDPDVVAKVREATGGGVDYAVEFASAVPAFATAYAVTRRGGTTVTASLPHPSATFALPITAMVAEERVVKGSYLGGCVPQRDIPRYVELYRRGLLPVDRLMSERIGLDAINEGFDRLAAGATVRQLLLPN
jgi:alcohol dehydrogenase